MAKKSDTEWYIPRGFSAAGLHCGIKASALDLALVVSAAPVSAAGVYTQNLVRAACIDWNRDQTPSDRIRAVVVNSGNANACTGERGFRDTLAMASAVAQGLSTADARVLPEQVLVLSTGVIGVQLPMEKVLSGIPRAIQQVTEARTGFADAANAIRTTDHHAKTASRRWEAGGQEYRIFGMCKGAGMIGPNMATMLAIVLSDWHMTSAEADMCLRHAADQSFNRISVEGHTSTNDCALLLAPRIPAAANIDHRSRDRDLYTFQQTLDEVFLELALQIPTDGEGATHLIEIRVAGTSSDDEADRIARTIALSNLVKTAVAGADPNWGRIVSAAGYAGVPFNPRDVGLSINGLSVFAHGEPASFDARVVSRSIADAHRTLIELEVGAGTGRAVHWTSDLTAAYVKLNAEYTT